MKVLGRNYLERKKAGLALIDAVAGVSEMEPVEIGSYRGFAIMTRLTAFDGSTPPLPFRFSAVSNSASRADFCWRSASWAKGFEVPAGG